MSLPAALRSALEPELGNIIESEPVGGGDISNAARLRLAAGSQVLVKWGTGLPFGLFTAERRGLALLSSAEALCIPHVVAQSEANADRPGFIVMEWLGRGPSTPKVADALGRGLAELHRVTAPTYGLNHDNFIGANPQINKAADSWVAFFCEQRLGFQMELAIQKGRLPGRRARLLEKLLGRLGEWLPVLPPASLLHGDLWAGNWLATDAGRPALIDPAVYYGHREAEIAFTGLFGKFPTTFYAAYNQTWALDSGYQERKDLYNLYHLLNHLNLFGESYGRGVDSVLGKYVG